MNYTVKPLQKQSEATEWEHAISAWKIKAKLHFVTTVIYFFSSQKCFSIWFQCWWAQCLPEMVGMQQASQWEVLSSVVSCWNTICLLPCSDLCRDLYSSVLLHFTSISGWRREESLWQVDLGLLPQPELTPSFWGDLYSSLVAACL